ncbi:nuclear transport factor 2-like isoform X2 [Nicotiana sylvestris]|uniref:Cold-inducible RNA-binding protein B-like isoform X1 n=1 Tax=Nicotiana sylvestris TaxID=4096 RepID=A0A1U7XKC0_NICSY|nr:PREDICTED: cold-inducible RNA-binding protein B-like isoform X1 [Nicotiana sylvestris]
MVLWKGAKQPVNSVAQAPAPQSSIPTASGGNVPESKVSQAGAEGHSIYVRNLPLNVTIAQLEVEFKRFGPIKQGVVQVRSNRQQGFCFGFVEFEDLSSMNRAIQASPVTIGGHQADVEIKRTTTRVGSGRGRFPSGRGGYRNDNFRGRGNFSGGRGYGRNDFVGEREFQVVEGVREDEVVKVTNKEEGEVVGEVA